MSNQRTPTSIKLYLGESDKEKLKKFLRVHHPGKSISKFLWELAMIEIYRVEALAPAARPAPPVGRPRLTPLSISRDNPESPSDSPSFSLAQHREEPAAPEGEEESLLERLRRERLLD